VFWFSLRQSRGWRAGPAALALPAADAARAKRGVTRPTPRAQAGFSLTELVITLTVAGVLTAMGLSMFSYVTNTARVSTEINELLTDVQYARVEAIKEGSTVTICSSNNGTSCSGSGDWERGWIVFSDLNNDQTVDPNDTVRRVQGAFKGSDTLKGGAISSMTFNRNGFAYNGLAAMPAATTITLHTTPLEETWTRCLLITQTGKALTETYGGGCL
jgi:type IV fimbrial biogenesis protein FimT